MLCFGSWQESTKATYHTARRHTDMPDGLVLYEIAKAIGKQSLSVPVEVR